MLASLFNKVVGLKEHPTFLKRLSNTFVSCGYYELFKATYFEKHKQTAAS